MLSFKNLLPATKPLLIMALTLSTNAMAASLPERVVVRGEIGSALALQLKTAGVTQTSSYDVDGSVKRIEALTGECSAPGWMRRWAYCRMINLHGYPDRTLTVHGDKALGVLEALFNVPEISAAFPNGDGMSFGGIRCHKWYEDEFFTCLIEP